MAPLYSSRAAVEKLTLMSVLIHLMHLHMCQELTLRLIIEKNSGLSILASDAVLQSTNVLIYLGNTELTSTVFFAPSNDAFNSMQPSLRRQLINGAKQSVDRVFQYHLVPGVNLTSPFDPLSVPEGLQTRALTLYSNTPVYVSKVNGTVYINGAQITMPSLTATNGMIHIIDKVFVADGPRPIARLVSSGYDFVTDQSLLMSDMFKIFTDYQLKNTIQQSGIYGQLTQTVLKNPYAYCTIFLPSNDSISRFKLHNQDLYARISGQTPSLLKQVVESLVIPNGAYHTTVLEKLTAIGRVVSAVMGQIRAYRMNGMLYVSNRCGKAQVLLEDVTTSNCVVHIIDDFLGLVTSDIYNGTLQQTDLQEFMRALLLESLSPLVLSLKVRGGPEYVVPESEKFTLFAPTNEIFQHVDFSRNSYERIMQLSMLISPQLVDLSYLNDGEKLVVDTMRPGYKATVSKVKQAYYVEVDHVRARVTQSNICTRNGFIHKVDRIIGLPEGTIGYYLGSWLELRRLEVLIQETGLLTLCINPTVRITLFAPNESAVMNLDSFFQGQQNKNKLTRLMYTHMSDSALYLDTIPDGSSSTLKTFNGDVKVERSGEDYWVVQGDAKVKVLQGNIGASNGVVHVIERFLPYVYGTAPSAPAMPMLILTACFVFV